MKGLSSLLVLLALDACGGRGGPRSLHPPEGSGGLDASGSGSFEARLFHRADCRKQDFSHGQLERTWFRGTNLFGADFTHALLDGAQFEGSNLFGADFSCASMRDVAMTEVALHGNDFSGAVLNGVRWRSLNFGGEPAGRAVHALEADVHAFEGGADFSRAQLSGADLSDSQLRGARFVGADCGGLLLQGADLRGATFDGADLRDANFKGARVVGASFVRADLRGAVLEEVTGLAPEMLRLARVDTSTVPPSTSADWWSSLPLEHSAKGPREH